MSEFVYDDVISVEEMMRGERVEREVEIYESADSVRGHNPNAQAEDTGTKRNIETHHTDTAWSRCYRVTAVCVVLLCVLLLTAITVLWIKYNNLNTENNKLQTSNNNLTKERDQLQTSNNNLTKENNQLKMERDAHLRRFYGLDKVRCFNSGLYFVSNEKKNWTESRQDCRDKGTDLVIINSQEEQDFITEQLKGGRAWIGLSDRDTEGEWKWVDGTLLTSGYSNWTPHQPDNYNNDEDCGETGNPKKQHWNDSPCSHEQGWICEKKNK